MDIRTMEYFLAVTREGNISAAAEALHVSQPALSRQMKDLEEELGVTLFERGSRRIRLSEEGMILRRRAEEMMRLMQITEREIRQAGKNISGVVHIGAGESLSFHSISRTAAAIRAEYPDIRFQITSGDTRDLVEQLDSGLIDIALVFTDYDRSLYQGIRLKEKEELGVWIRKDSPLAEKEVISADDLRHVPLIMPRGSMDIINTDPHLSQLGCAAVYNLIYNASLFVEDGIGAAIGFKGLISSTGESPLTFRPLAESPSQSGTVIWKKYEVFSPAVNVFLDMLKKQCEGR